MQADKKEQQFRVATGKIINKYRELSKTSINKLGNEYDLGKGNISRLERGVLGMNLLTAYKLSEALGIKFTDFAQALQDELGEGFSFYDD